MSDERDSNGWQEATRRIEEAKNSGALSLDLSNLALTDVPDSLHTIKALEQVDLTGNKLTAVPDSLRHCASLSALKIQGNFIAAIPIWIAELAELRIVDFSYNQLTTIPESLAELPRLRLLALSGSQLTSFPDWIGRVQSLRSLFLASNSITTVPESITRCTALDTLYLAGNQIKTVPSFLAQLTNLRHLNLDSNGLSAIPETVTQITNLRHLSLDRNNIAVIPDSFFKLTNLEKLELKSNRITTIPSSLAQLTSLRALYLGGNQITDIPESLTQLTNLKEFILDDNPLPEEVLAALKQGIPQLLRYLESTAKRKVYPRTVKLVLLGEPRSGKTTLLEALKGSPHPCDEFRQETLGVNVVTIEKPHPSDHQPMYLSAWDFAGQHIEHATHQFFLTENAIYLILWNARQGAASGKHDLWYWLELLKMRVREPKFLLIATHTEHTPPDLNLADIERAYPGCQGHFPVELSSLKGFGSLESKILELAATLPSMRAPWPPEWREIRDQVRNIRKEQPYMTPETFSVFMEKNGVTGEQAQKDIAGQLHHLGEILFFQERDELSSLVILNPEWVTELIALVLRSKQVREHNGILRKADLDALWHQASLTPEVRDHLIHLMDWFDLTYSTGHKTDLGIVVEALPYSRPEDLKRIDLPPQSRRWR